MVQNVVQRRPMREGLVEIHGSEPGCSVEVLGGEPGDVWK